MPKIVASKKDWIKLGFKLFSETGEVGLNVDKMSRILKCNKSSFYWHFKTKKDFIHALVEYWINFDTGLIMTEVNKQLSPKDKLLKLIELALKKDSNLDFIFYLKKYSQTNKQLRTSVDGIDQERIDFVSSLLVEMNYSKEQAQLKALIFYKYLIGYHEMIRYKKQNKDYLSEALLEINQFITLNNDAQE